MYPISYLYLSKTINEEIYDLYFLLNIKHIDKIYYPFCTSYYHYICCNTQHNIKALYLNYYFQNKPYNSTCRITFYILEELDFIQYLKVKH